MAHNGKFRLRNLDFDEVSLVSSGDDPHALMVLSKSNPEGSTMNVLSPDFNFFSKRGKRKPKLGSGKRFSALTAELAARGAYNPAALAAWIGRRKYGARRFGQLGSKRGAGRTRINKSY